MPTEPPKPAATTAAPQPTAPTDKASVIALLPDKAKLTINGMAMADTGTRRSFISPSLAPGKGYGYTFRAEIIRDGKTEVVVRDIVVRPGEETVVDMHPAAVTAALR